MASFTRAIVRRPAKTLIDGIADFADLGKPIYEVALEQHDAYIAALEACGLEVTVLPALDEYPDSCFVEDTCIVTPHGVVVDNPARGSRNAEAKAMEPTLLEFFSPDQIRRITAPGTLEGGDVMLVDDTFYVGKSTRTNDEGFRQFKTFVAEWGYDAVQVPVSGYLHLKTGTTYIDDNKLLAAGDFANAPELAHFDVLAVPDEEDYAVNCLSINGKLVMSKGFPTVRTMLEELGREIIEVPMTEYRKIDGSLTCLSLRF